MITPEQRHKIAMYFRQHQPEWVGVFGSWALGENRPDSDLDILIKLAKPVSLLTFIKMEDELSNLLGTPVDIVSEGGVKNPLHREYIFQDLLLIV